MTQIHLQKIEAGAGPGIVILHGLLGAARNWGAAMRDLSADHRVVALDLPNHGGSDWTDRMDYPFLSKIVAEWIVDQGEPMTILGHSMGGKIAMTLALTAPSLVRALMICDMAPVSYTHDFRGLIGAMKAVPLASITKRSEVESALAVDVPEPPLRAFLMQNLESSPLGFRWRANLDAFENNHADIVGFPDFPADAAFGGPALFVSGGLSHYVSRRDHPTILRLFPRAEFRELAGCGHWLHADDPKGFIAAIREFLSRHQEVRADLKA